MKQEKDIASLDDVIGELAVPNPLPENYQDHPLKGEYKGYRDCHIGPDRILIYGYETLDDGERRLFLVRTGPHSDLLEWRGCRLNRDILSFILNRPCRPYHRRRGHEQRPRQSQYPFADNGIHQRVEPVTVCAISVCL
jgi:mRNA interferase YafQ